MKGKEQKEVTRPSMLDAVKFAELALPSYKLSNRSYPVDQAKFEKAVDYAISRGYFRQRDTADIDQSTNESGLITLRTSGGTRIAQFKEDGEGFDGVGELSRKQEPKQFQSFKCIKCGSHEFSTGEMRVSGGFWASAFEIENNRFNWIACNNCGHTEFYKRNVPGAQKVFDYLIN